MTVPFRGSSSELSKQKLRAKAYVRVTRDVYLLSDRAAQLKERVQAAHLIFPKGVPCLQTAALLLNLPVDDDGIVHLAGGTGSVQSERADLVVHRVSLRPDEIATVKGMEVARGPRTFADLSAELTLEELVAVGDVVLRRCDPAAVKAAVARHARRRGVVLLRKALPLLDPGSDSPAETRARLRLHAAGFTGLRHKVIVTDGFGGWLATPDLADPVARVAIQHEGLIHFQKGEKQRRQDLDRDELTRAQDWQVVVSTAIDDAKPEQLITKVTAAYLRSAQLWGPSVLPVHLRASSRSGLGPVSPYQIGS